MVESADRSVDDVPVDPLRRELGGKTARTVPAGPAGNMELRKRRVVDIAALDEGVERGAHVVVLAAEPQQPAGKLSAAVGPAREQPDAGVECVELRLGPTIQWCAAFPSGRGARTPRRHPS